MGTTASAAARNAGQEGAERKTFTIPLALLQQIRPFATTLAFETEFSLDPVHQTVRLSAGQRKAVHAPILPGLTINLHTHPSEAIYGRGFEHHPPTDADLLRVLGDSLKAFKPVTSVVVEPGGVWVYRPTFGLLLYMLDLQPDLPLIIFNGGQVSKQVVNVYDILRTNTGILGHDLAFGKITLDQYLTETRHYLLTPPPPDTQGAQQSPQHPLNDDGFDIQYYPFDELTTDISVPAWKLPHHLLRDEGGCTNPGFPVAELVQALPSILAQWQTVVDPTQIPRDSWVPICRAPKRRLSTFALPQPPQALSAGGRRRRQSVS